VDLSLTEGQRAVQEVARRLAEEKLAPLSLIADDREELPLAALKEAGAARYGAMFVSEEAGGAGLTRMEGALAFEALAYGDPAVAAFISVHNMATWAMWFYGTPQVSEPWLSRLQTFQALASFCLTEPQAGSDAASLRATASRQGDAVVIDGEKAFITGGGSAGVYVVAARSGQAGPKGISLYVVPGDSAGISVGPPERKMGWRAQPTSRVVFHRVSVPLDNLLGSDGMGFAIAMRALDGGRLNIAACSIGGAQAALDKATLYLNNRRAFGQRLAEFQALQFKLADMEMKVQAARALVYSAAWRLDNATEDASTFCAMAKCVASETAFSVANDALQLHGGNGYMREFGLEKLVRDLRAHPIVEGTNEIMRLIVARRLLDAADPVEGSRRAPRP
jgi:alkylation response protein AidB-like acyl-CoA dehydrogenase